MILKRRQFFDFIQETFLVRADKNSYGRELFGFKTHSFATMGKLFFPGDIIVFTFMAINHGDIFRLTQSISYL